MEHSFEPVMAQKRRSDAQRPVRQMNRLRVLSIGAGIVAALVLILLIALGSRGFHWFDAALIGYAVAAVFATAAVTYKYTFWLARWLARPPTGLYRLWFFGNEKEREA